MIHPTAGTGFGRQADAYERARPDYPDVAVDAIASLASGRVLDLAAGTGKLTRALVSRGLRVVAVEPVAAMRRHLPSPPAPDAIVAAVAEHLPFAASSFALVTVGQAFHWFDRHRTSQELDRVVDDDGHVALVANARVATEPWQRRLWDLMDRLERDAPWKDPEPSAPVLPWREVDRSSHPHRTPTTVELVVDRMASTSHVAALDDGARQAVLDEVASIAASAPPPLAVDYRTTWAVYRR